MVRGMDGRDMHFLINSLSRVHSLYFNLEPRVILETNGPSYKRHFFSFLLISFHFPFLHFHFLIPTFKVTPIFDWPIPSRECFLEF